MATRRSSVDQARRLKFIDEELFWRGEITRARIMQAFGVHEDTAKGDLRAYRRHYAPDLQQSRTDQKYRVGEDFRPRMEPAPVAEDYLRRLAGGGFEDMPAGSSAGIEVDVTPLLARRRVDPLVLQGLVRALGAGQEIEILYRSPNSAEAKPVWILPEGFLHDGFRWSCRCYRYDIGGWGEAVLDRIEDDLGQRRPADRARLGADAGWLEHVVLRLGPNPGLEPAHRAAIEAQYNMAGGVAAIAVRKCQVAYFLKRYQLEEPVSLKAPHQAPLVLLNRDEAVAAIPPGMRVPLADRTEGVARLMADARAAFPGLNEQEIVELALRNLLSRKGGDRSQTP